MMLVTYTKEDIAKAKENGIPYATFYNRIYTYGWTVHDAIHTPKMTKKEAGAVKRK